MGLKEFFEDRIKKVTGIQVVDDKTLAELEQEIEFSAQPLSGRTRVGGHLLRRRKFMTVEQIHKRRERVQMLYSKYR